MRSLSRSILAVCCLVTAVSCADDIPECESDAECDDGNICTTDACSSTHVCLNEPVSCDDGVFCNGDEVCNPTVGCEPGAPRVIDDEVPCTIDFCDDINDVIVHEPDHDACDDGLFCNGTEICDVQNDCQPGLGRNLDDGIACTDDSCDEDNDVVVHAPNDGMCDNGVFCDGAEACDPMNGCQPGMALAIDDGVSCTHDSCDEENDIVIHATDDSLCDDTLFCNGIEVCDAALDCQAGPPITVDDGVDCTLDLCDEINDTVVNLTDDNVCNDSLFCNGVESCDAVNGCMAGVPPSIDDGVTCTDNACDEINDILTVMPNDALCDDSLFCNGSEICDAIIGCMPGTPPVLDDGVGCTVDTCDETTDAVISVPSNSLCNDMDGCTTDTCDPGNDCQYAANAICTNCDTVIVDNGAAGTTLGAGMGVAWSTTGVMDEFSLTEPNTDFCTIQFTLLRDITVEDFQAVRVRIYDLGAGSIATLGDFDVTTPVFDHTYQASDGTLAITDTGTDVMGYDVLRYEAVGRSADLGPGNFGLHLTFPGVVFGDGFWAPAPTAGTGQCAFEWGEGVMTPNDLCTDPMGGLQFENLAFELRDSEITGYSFTSSPNLATMDMVTVTDTLSPGGSSCLLIDMEVDIVIAHTYFGDLFIDLTHDDSGTTVGLLDANVNGQELINRDLMGLYTWSDDPTGNTWASVNVTPAPMSPPTYLPDVDPLSSFSNLNVSGDWTLSVYDQFFDDSGVISAWTIRGQCIE